MVQVHDPARVAAIEVIAHNGVSCGGKVRAAAKLLHGPRAIARLAASVWRLYLSHQTMEAVDVNGGPGLLLRDAGGVRAVMAFETDGVHIHAVYSVLNPDKLRGL